VIVDHAGLAAGRYRIDERLGRGGMGTGFAGHDLRLDRDVAVKVLRDDLGHDPALRRRFEREARSAARVAHPHAVAIYDTGEDSDHDAFIVMERLSGRTLGHELAEGPLTDARLREVAGQVLGALAAAHREGIVHRDVKPGNILLADDSSVKVADFGIATTLEGDDTSTAVPVGTPAYTAPERLRGLAATPCSDLYSLGVVLYEAAAGVRPFRGEGASAVVEAVVAGTHPPLAERRPDLPPAFVAAVERALATDPAARFVDAESMRAVLTGTATAAVAVTVPLPAPSATVVLPAPPAPPTREPERRAPTPPIRRRLGRAPILLAALMVVLVAVAVVLLVTRNDDSSAPPASTAPSTAPAPTAAPANGPAVPAPLARALDRLDQATRP
jgi:serine/threonine-protein kinase